MVKRVKDMKVKSAKERVLEFLSSELCKEEVRRVRKRERARRWSMVPCGDESKQERPMQPQVPFLSALKAPICTVIHHARRFCRWYSTGAATDKITRVFRLVDLVRDQQTVEAEEGR